MKANELRLGNLIETNIVQEVNIQHLEFLLNPDIKDKSVIKPIPLTEEWLQRFGFEFSWMSGQALIQKKIKYDLRFVRPYYKDNLGELVLDLRNDSTSLNTKVRYVHSLQNLYFALTGEELSYSM